MRTIGVTARGIRAPIIYKGDDLIQIVVSSLEEAHKTENLSLGNKDVLAVTESVLARSQGNYVTVDNIAEDIIRKFGEDATITVVNPIFSRNRFSIILKGIARAAKKIRLLVQDEDEVGNVLQNHPFTGVDYLDLYRGIVFIEDCEFQHFYAGIEQGANVIIASIHSRAAERESAECIRDTRVYDLTDICNQKTNEHGYNEDYGLLGSNKASEESLKLFPHDCQTFVDQLKSRIYKRFNQDVEIMVYGDGAFKDPVGKIWEFADPVVSPGFTSGLEGTPNEIKMKYIADTELVGTTDEGMREYIRAKKDDLVGDMTAQGTTPRRYTDLLGSLCDLISGSGDKGTPIVLVQGYFDNYATD